MIRSLSLCAAALLLAACNTTETSPMRVAAPAPAPAAQASAPQYVTPSSFRMPEGSGCGGDIGRFRAVMDNDLATGHVNKAVYDQVIREIGPAESACSAGRSGEALASLRAVKSRHGYPG